VALVFAAAFASWMLVEKPALRLKTASLKQDTAVVVRSAA